MPTSSLPCAINTFLVKSGIRRTFTLEMLLESWWILVLLWYNFILINNRNNHGNRKDIQGHSHLHVWTWRKHWRNALPPSKITMAIKKTAKVTPICLFRLLYKTLKELYLSISSSHLFLHIQQGWRNRHAYSSDKLVTFDHKRLSDYSVLLKPQHVVPEKAPGAPSDGAPGAIDNFP